MDAQCLISFGSNLGDRDGVIAEAARLVASSPLVDGLQTSRLFTTPPVGGPDGQEPFLNAVGAFDTRASAREILGLLQKIENDLGRKRLTRWGARCIDLDVVLHGELVGGGTGLIVPHPRYTSRRFVLEPACDVAAHYRDPRFGWTIRRLTDHLATGAPSLALTGDDEATRHLICRRLSDDYGIQTFAAKPIAAPMTVVGNAPAAPEPRPESRQPADPGGSIDVNGDVPWVSEFIPELPAVHCHPEPCDLAIPMDHIAQPKMDSSAESRFNDPMASFSVPRLVARLQRTTPQTRWPAPHQMWPAGWQWPEYRLEVDDIDWAVAEVASALQSMRCDVTPATSDGDWWR